MTQQFKKIQKEGYANIIFSSKPIEYGAEDEESLKKVFTKPDPIYARCYFPNHIGKIEKRSFWHEIWIDGKFIKRTLYESPPDPEWDQIQIWITDDDYKNEILNLDSGKHEIVIWVMKCEFEGKYFKIETTLSGDPLINEKERVKLSRLSKGNITYVVP
ncbi:MAG: hypothetical protein KGD63_07295 [Candidatus Lokiarchaeota archaeon]|nr:hypothetical protein [Candidatus Lokiarchaeota archaeon]